MQFAIKDIPNNKIDPQTVSSTEEGAWNLWLGFKADDDQWAWQKQKAESRGFFVVEIELKVKFNDAIDTYIGIVRKLYKESEKKNK